MLFGCSVKSCQSSHSTMEECSKISLQKISVALPTSRLVSIHQLSYCTISHRAPSTVSLVRILMSPWIFTCLCSHRGKAWFSVLARRIKYAHSSTYIRCCNGSYFLYCITVWLKIEDANSAHVRASLKTENAVYNCVGSAAAKQGCWSFLKGGFVLDSPSNLSMLFFQVISQP